MILWALVTLLQAVSLPRCEKEDTAQIMSAAYWARWNEAEQARIDADIERYRKADAVFHTGRVRRGTRIHVEQVSHAFVFGASIFNFNQLGTTRRNDTYKALFDGTLRPGVSLFNRATVPFYWTDLEPEEGRPRLAGEERDTETWWNACSDPKAQPHWRRPAPTPIVDWCEAHGVAVHGHPLVWGNRNFWPSYLMQDAPASEKALLEAFTVKYNDANGGQFSRLSEAYTALPADSIARLLPVWSNRYGQRMREHIRSLMKAYGSRIGSWDVVNESCRDAKAGLLADSKALLSKSFYGPMPGDYVYAAFDEAAQYASDETLLNINDFDKTSDYPAQVRNLLSRGARIDVVGVQMHLFDPKQCQEIAEGHPRQSPEAVRTYLGLAAEPGKPVCISEITLTSPSPDARGLAIQAVITRNLYRLWFSHPEMMGITWWNIVDGCGALDETTVSGLFTRDMQPKPAFFALDELINHEWRTVLDLAPDRHGDIHFRGFRGTYRITWTDGRGHRHIQMLEL